MKIFVSLSSKIGEEQTSDDAEDGPPELLVRIELIMTKKKTNLIL